MKILLTEEDYSLGPTLEFEGFTSYVKGGEPDRFAFSHSGRVTVSHGRDEELQTHVGDFSLIYVDADLAINDGEALYDVCDAHSQELLDCYDALYVDGEYKFKLSVVNTGEVDREPQSLNLLFIKYLNIFPEHQGKGLGRATIAGLIKRFQAGSGLIAAALPPSQALEIPHQDNDFHIARKRAMAIKAERLLQQALCLRMLTSLGFKRVPRADYAVISPLKVTPEINRAMLTSSQRKYRCES